jgi:penicillin-binding protein 1A
MTPRQRRRRRLSHRRHHKLLAATAILTASLGVSAAAAAVWVIDVADDEPALGHQTPVRLGMPSEILAADGSRLGYVSSDTIREPIAGRRIPPALGDATVAIEDRNFYDHGALDYAAIARAAVADLGAGKVVEGGSTITQQLVKNLYLSNPSDTLARKVREAKLAIELEQRRSKRWILDHYLNSVAYGTTAGVTDVGVQAASRTYFSRPASALDLRRSALLAGLPQAPSDYDPLLHPHRARDRRNEVLDQMYAQGYIDARQRQRAKAAGLGLDPGDRYTTVRDPYFFDYVQEQLIRRYGVRAVRDGGLVVRTTLDPRLQALAQTAVDDGAARLSGPSAALVATDVATGHVLAMAASTDYGADQFNVAADGHRQPGSAFKPFVLATALKQGINPDKTFYDGSSPVTLYPYGRRGEPWTVNNAEPGQGRMSVTQATTDSVNAVYAQLDLDVGPQNVAATAGSLGITSPLDGYPSEGIGGLRVGVSPLEMSNAYASFADGGVHHPSSAIEGVTLPGGRVDRLGAPTPTRALSATLASTETRVLKTVIASGTGTAANIGCPAAGKTGTTDEQTDAWFVGYTPRISTAVWTGYPAARHSMGPSAFGGSYAAPIWHQFMDAARGGYCGDFSG